MDPFVRGTDCPFHRRQRLIATMPLAALIVGARAELLRNGQIQDPGSLNLCYILLWHISVSDDKKTKTLFGDNFWHVVGSESGSPELLESPWTS